MLLSSKPGRGVCDRGFCEVFCRVLSANGRPVKSVTLAVRQALIHRFSRMWFADECFRQLAAAFFDYMLAGLNSDLTD